MICYADDTIVVSTNKEACNELLHHTEAISKQYGLSLNKDTCVNLNMNTGEQQEFQDGAPLQTDKETVYLRIVLNSKANS